MQFKILFYVVFINLLRLVKLLKEILFEETHLSKCKDLLKLISKHAYAKQ